MTIDERLEELKSKHEMLSERHNALVLSIELMILESREETRKRDGLWKAHMETWKTHMEAWKEQNEAWALRFGQVASSLDQLVHVAELHQHRIDSHDERIDRLEGAA